MGERKVLNKYIPADFDPTLIPRGKKLSTKDGTVPVRMMLPFTIQCSSCHTFLYRGRKFNSKKEPMGGPDGRYLGIQRFRFYIKCTQCSRTLSFLTDPKNADYEMESGGTRNYEVHKDREKTEEESALEKEEEEKDDPMKALENRVLESQREMADLDNLAEIQAMNRRHIQIMSSTAASSKPGQEGGFDAETKALLDAREAALERQRKAGMEEVELNEHGVTEEEEELVKSIQFGKNRATSNNGSNGVPYSASTSIMRLSEEDEKRAEEKRLQDLASIQSRQKELDDPTKRNNIGPRPTIKIKKRKKAAGSTTTISKAAAGNDSPTVKKAKQEKTTERPQREAAPDTGLAGLLGGYGSDSESD